MSDRKEQTAPTINPVALPSAHAIEYLSSLLRTIPDFPKPGIMFKDITPLLADPRGLNMVLDLMAEPFIGANIQHTVAMEARGFIFGGALAARLNHSFVPIRKPGKLPADVDEVSYSLEYGEGRLQMHKGSISPGDQVLIVDDLLATGGTAAASAKLVQTQGGVVAAFLFVIELDFLKGVDKLREQTDEGVSIFSLIHVVDGLRLSVVKLAPPASSASCTRSIRPPCRRNSSSRRAASSLAAARRSPGKIPAEGSMSSRPKAGGEANRPAS